MPKVSEERKAEVRNRLLDSAVDLLMRKGAVETTTRDIAEQAGLSAGALYHYFSSKEELFGAIADRFVADDPVLAADAVTEPHEAAQVQTAILVSLFGRESNSILPQLRMASLSSEQLRGSLDHFDRSVVERSGALNRQCQDAGLFVDDLDGEALAELVETFYEGFVLRDQLGAFATTRSRVLGLFLELLSARAVDHRSTAAEEFIRSIKEIAEQ